MSEVRQSLTRPAMTSLLVLGSLNHYLTSCPKYISICVLTGQQRKQVSRWRDDRGEIEKYDYYYYLVISLLALVSGHTTFQRNVVGLGLRVVFNPLLLPSLLPASPFEGPP